MSKNYRAYELRDFKGNVIAFGSKKDCLRVAYPRFVYCHIYTDELYKNTSDIVSREFLVTMELLNK